MLDENSVEINVMLLGTVSELGGITLPGNIFRKPLKLQDVRPQCPDILNSPTQTNFGNARILGAYGPQPLPKS